jgi:hypothetical protein
MCSASLVRFRYGPECSQFSTLPGRISCEHPFEKTSFRRFFPPRTDDSPAIDFASKLLHRQAILRITKDISCVV